MFNFGESEKRSSKIFLPGAVDLGSFYTPQYSPIGSNGFPFSLTFKQKSNTEVVLYAEESIAKSYDISFRIQVCYWLRD